MVNLKSIKRCIIFPVYLNSLSGLSPAAVPYHSLFDILGLFMIMIIFFDLIFRRSNDVRLESFHHVLTIM